MYITPIIDPKKGLLEEGEEEEGGDRAGYDLTVIWGNCIVIDMNFWFQERVQKYLQLVLVGTGGDVRFRWAEQGIMSFIWQIFVPKDRFEELPLAYEHPHEGSDCY